MARLEIELVGINKNLKQTLKESKTDLTAFAKSLGNIKPTGVNALNTSLRTTKKLLADISKDARKAADAVNRINRVQNGQGTSFIPPGQDAEIDRARQAEARYREETQRLVAELNRLRLANAQNRQQTTAAAGSYREAQQQLTALGRSIRDAAGGFNSTNPAIQAQIRQYRTLNERLTAFDRQLGNHQRNVGNYRSVLNGIGSQLSAAFGFGALLAVGAKVIRTNLEISDALSDVRRTAGLTSKEVDVLASSLKDIDTRTGLKDLLGIATIGGQLGIAKNQLAGFTEAIDQLSVALGGELQGGAEGIAKSLGVLDNVFDVTKSNAGDVNKAYNQIGSAILGLGQSGLATGDFLADFGERVGGLAKQAGLSVPIILSYGAVLQESGVSAEVAGSAFKRLLSSLSSNSAGFLKVAQIADANLSLKEFNTIINTDTRKALDLFFQGLQKGGSSTVAFNTILKSLKLSGGGVSQVIAALSQNQEVLNGHIRDATKDFNDATLASEQFRLKNDNLAGSVDKLGNTLTNLTTNPNSNVANFFKFIVDSINDGIKALDEFTDKIRNVQYNSAINNYRRTGKTGNGFLSESDVRKEIDRRNRLERENSRSAQVNSRSAAIVNSSPNKNSLLKNIKIERDKLNAQLGQYNYAQAYIAAPENRDIKQVEAFRKRSEKLLPVINTQSDLVKKLTGEYTKLYIATTRSNADTPTGFGKKGRGSSTPSAPNVLPLLDSAELSGLDGVDSEIEKARLKYSEYYGKLDEYNKKKNANITLSNQLRAKAEIAEGKEVANIIINENKRVADEVASINEKAGIVREASRLKDLQANDVYYNEQIRKNAGQNEILAALENARLQERKNINKKYDDEFLADVQKVQDKIVELQEKGFTENIKGNERGRAKVREQLADRLKDIQKYFDELRKLYKNDPIATIGLNAAQLGVTRNVTANAVTAGNPVDAQQREAIRSVVDSFGRDVANTLRNLSTTADGTFSGIFTSLTGSLSNALNDIFLNQFTKKLSESLTTTGNKLKLTLNDAIAGVGLVGGLVSGSTKKTSVAGQGLGGALSGAAAGFAIGGPLGAAIGGGLGLISGIFGANKAKKEEQLQQQQLNESKRQTALLERANALAYASQIVGRQTLNGIVYSVDINEFGNVITKVSGSDLLIVHDRSVANRKRGK